jgi:dienelactone hydrolase
MKTSTNTKNNFFNAFCKLSASLVLIIFSKISFAQVERTWSKGAFIFPEELAKEIGTPIGNVAVLEKYMPLFEKAVLTNKYKPAILMHGCGGITRENIEHAKLLASMGIPVFLPSYYARSDAQTLCAGSSSGAVLFINISRQDVNQRIEEFEYAVKKLKELHFIDSSQILASGHSMGGLTVAQVKNPSVGATVITGWGCFGVYSGQSPKHIPQLAIRFKVDPFLSSSESCEAKFFSSREKENTFSVVLDGQETHEVMHNEKAKDEIRKFVGVFFVEKK